MTKIDQKACRATVGTLTMEAASGYGVFRFSTDDLPAAKRLPYMREVLGRCIARMDLSPVAGRPLRWAARMYLLDGLSVITGETSGHSARRGPHLLADGNDDVLLTTNRLGFSLVSQAHRDCRLDGGLGVFMSAAEPGVQDFPGPAAWFSLCIPRRGLAGLVETLEDAVNRPVPADMEAFRLLVDYVEMGLRGDRLASSQLRHVFTTHVHDLVALMIGATRDATEVARGRGLRAARLNAAKADIASRLENEGLSVVDVARRLGVTPRYLQKLFESEATSFTEYVTRQRLARTYRMLRDPRFLHRTVVAIAFEVGFGNLSHFNRLFRRHYGTTPSDVRASAMVTMMPDGG
jgi:AraC-like DNA-binding protein